MDQQQYEHQSECQDYADYGPEGYYPVVLGERFNHTYVVIQKLGWGHFSTVWLVQNEKTKQYGALKIQRSKQSHCQSAEDEMKLLQLIRRHEREPTWILYLSILQEKHPEHINSKLCRPLILQNSFLHYGIHGKHYCSVFEILGPNLLDVIQHYEFKNERMPLWLVKKITIDVLLGLVYLHDHCDIIHTDLKPENIMIKMEAQEEKQFIENIKQYKVKPISMKYLKNLQSSKNPKSKKKNQKKKLKKKQKKEGQKGESKQQQDNDEQVEENLAQKCCENNSKEKEQIQEKTKKTEQKSPKENEGEKKNNEGKGNSSENNLTEMKDVVKSEQIQNNGMNFLKWKNVKIELNRKLFFKIVDMGNACFSNHHFTEDIQTRQYRSPEVILGYSYSTSTDIWSLGCTIFQMLTNSFLFKPRKIEGISKNEDHLYKIIQVLGPLNKQYCLNGKNSAQYFNKKGKLLHGHPKQHVRIHQLLNEEYDYSLQDAVQIEQFLLPMLEIQDSNRVSARQCLANEWLWK